MVTVRTMRSDFWAVAALVLIVSITLLSCGSSGGGGTNPNLKYTMTYDGNGSTSGSAPIDTTSYEQGQTVTVPGNSGNLIKTGYSFSGWNTQADGNGTTYTQSQTFAIGAADVALHAKWTANPTYTVTYNANGSTGGSVPIDATNYEQGQTVMVPGNTGTLAKTGYAFAGWNTQADGNGTTYTQSQTFAISAADVALHAKWTANPAYTVTYNANGSTGGSVPIDATNYEQGQTVTVPGNSGSLVKTGYAFASWNTLADGSGTDYAAAATFTMSAANVTLYAKWTANPTYAVIYDGNGCDSGSVPVDSISYEQGQTVTVRGNSGTLVKAGYSFAGWNILADGSGTGYAAAATFTMSAAQVTLYAKWAIFMDNHDGTMTDNRTGLMWIKSPPSVPMQWQASMDYCDTLDFAGHSDWRLPNRYEIGDIRGGWSGDSPGAWLTSQGFGTVPGDEYWSSTNDTGDPNMARTIYMSGDGAGSAYKVGSHYLWPVRTGP